MIFPPILVKLFYCDQSGGIKKHNFIYKQILTYNKINLTNKNIFINRFFL